jgi:carbon storage regulator CsrA
MLVLSRKPDQEIVVLVGGEVITIVVCQARDGRVRLGFEASPEVRIWRREIYDAMVARGEDGLRECLPARDAAGR